MVGDRLKKFAENRFGSVAGLEQALGMPRNSLSQYIYNRNIPGGKLLMRLREIGCDINWLLTGEASNNFGFVREPDIGYSNDKEKIKQLEQENRLLRDRIIQISQLIQDVENLKQRHRKK